MRYTFHKWRARKVGSAEWRELGWCMTEEDARDWAEDNGHEVEPIPGAPAREVHPHGSSLGSTPLGDAAQPGG